MRSAVEKHRQQAPRSQGADQLPCRFVQCARGAKWRGCEPRCGTERNKVVGRIIEGTLKKRPCKYRGAPLPCAPCQRHEAAGTFRLPPPTLRGPPTNKVTARWGTGETTKQVPGGNVAITPYPRQKAAGAVRLPPPQPLLTQRSGRKTIHRRVALLATPKTIHAFRCRLIYGRIYFLNFMSSSSGTTAVGSGGTQRTHARHLFF